MGSYSEITVILNKDAAARVDKKIEGAFNCVFRTRRLLGDESVLYHDQSVKWSTMFPPVDTIQAFLDSLDNEEKDETYEFLRIGENNSVEHYNTGLDEDRLDIDMSVTLDEKPLSSFLEEDGA